MTWLRSALRSLRGGLAAPIGNTCSATRLHADALAIACSST